MAPRYKMTPALIRILNIEITAVSKRTPIVPFLVGEPGIGKSSIVRAICNENDWHFHELLCNQLGDRTDLTGCRTVKETEIVNGTPEEIWKQIFFPHKSVQDAITDAKNNPNDIILLFLDEINRTSSDITSAILSFVTARTIGTYTFPENIRFIVAGNDKGNVTMLDTASISRFAKFNIEPDAANWITYTKSIDTLSPYIEKVLNEHPELIFCREMNTVTSTTKTDDGDQFENEYAAFDDAPEGFSQITTSRTLSGLNVLLNELSFDDLKMYNSTIMKDADSGEDMTMLQAVIQSHIGHTAFAQYLVQKINDDIISGNMKKASAAAKPPVQPAAYNQLRRCGDRTTQSEMLGNMSSEDLSELLVFMLFDKTHDNKDLIDAVCSVYPDEYLHQSWIPKLTTLYNEDMLDGNNVDTFRANNSILSKNMCKITFA